MPLKSFIEAFYVLDVKQTDIFLTTSVWPFYINLKRLSVAKTRKIVNLKDWFFDNFFLIQIKPSMSRL
jgi:hypothetical protein